MLIHLGIVLLLLGQMLTDFLSRESALHLRIGETKNYSEADRAFELAVMDTTDPDSDKVVAIPCSLLVRRGEVSDPEMPFDVRVKTFYANSLLGQQPQPGYEPVKTTAGLGSGLWWREVPRETEMDRHRHAVGHRRNRHPAGFAGHVSRVRLAGPAAIVHLQPPFL